MQDLSKNYVILILFITTLTVVPLAGQAQNIWVEEPEGETEVGLDFRIPSFNGFNVDGVAFANYFYSNIALGRKTTLQLDLPISHFSNGGRESNFGVGNPYVGLQFGAPNASTKFDLGVRLPLQNEFELAHTAGFITENYTRGAFIPDATSLISNIHYRYNKRSAFGFRVGGGPELVAVKDGDAELFLKSYTQLLYNMGYTTFGGGLNGQWFATAGGGDFSSQTNFNLGLFGSRDFGQVSSGAYMEVPLDNAQINYMIGLNLSFEL
ncbi:MAG: hypothetical protein JXR26_06230 [Balneolaceae bacterium]|nr:hypothetical protein [Balneolaceae bacterium]